LHNYNFKGLWTTIFEQYRGLFYLQGYFMANAGDTYISRYLPANHARTNIWDAAVVDVANSDGTWMRWLFANEHWYNSSDSSSFTYSCESWWIQGMQRGRLYRGQFDDVASRTDGGGIFYPPGGSYYPYSAYQSQGWRTFGRVSAADRCWLRWDVPGGMTHFRIWVSIYEDADATVIQQNIGESDLTSTVLEYINTVDAKRGRPHDWISLADGAAFIKVLNDNAVDAADFVLIGVEFIDLNTEVDPDYGGWAVMYDSFGGSGVDDLLSFPEPNDRGYSSVEIACYHQSVGDDYGDTETGSSYQPQFGGVSHKGRYDGTLSVTVDGVSWNPKTGDPVKGSIIISTSGSISNDWIETPYSSVDQYKVCELDITYTFDGWKLTIDRTLDGTEEDSRAIWALYAVLFSTPPTCDYVRFGKGAVQDMPESPLAVYGEHKDRSLRIEDSTLGVVWIGNYTMGRDVGADAAGLTMYDNTTFYRTYIQYVVSDETSAPVLLEEGNTIQFVSDYIVFNSEDESLAANKTFTTDNFTWTINTEGETLSLIHTDTSTDVSGSDDQYIARFGSTNAAVTSWTDTGHNTTRLDVTLDGDNAFSMEVETFDNFLTVSLLDETSWFTGCNGMLEFFHVKYYDDAQPGLSERSVITFLGNGLVAGCVPGNVTTHVTPDDRIPTDKENWAESYEDLEYPGYSRNQKIGFFICTEDEWRDVLSEVQTAFGYPFTENQIQQTDEINEDYLFLRSLDGITSAQLIAWCGRMNINQVMLVQSIWANRAAATPFAIVAGAAALVSDLKSAGITVVGHCYVHYIATSGYYVDNYIEDTDYYDVGLDYHVIDMSSSLIDDMGEDFATTVETLGLDGLYFDGNITGSTTRPARDDAPPWYANARVTEAMLSNLSTMPKVMQMSSNYPYDWQFINRSGQRDYWHDATDEIVATDGVTYTGAGCSDQIPIDSIETTSTNAPSIQGAGRQLDYGWFSVIRISDGCDPRTTSASRRPSWLEWQTLAEYSIADNGVIGYYTGWSAHTGDPYVSQIEGLIASTINTRLGIEDGDEDEDEDSSSGNEATIEQTTSATFKGYTIVDYTTFSVPDVGQTDTQYQIAEQYQTFDNPLINVTYSSRQSLLTNGNLKSLDRIELSVILDHGKYFKFRFRTKTSGTWSSWSTPQKFRVRDKDYKYDIPNNTTVTETSTGAIVVNNTLPSDIVRIRKTARGARVVTKNRDGVQITKTNRGATINNTRN